VHQESITTGGCRAGRAAAPHVTRYLPRSAGSAAGDLLRGIDALRGAGGEPDCSAVGGRGRHHELESACRELQSTNEVLETTNEELQTLNDEVRIRGEDLKTSRAFFQSVLSSLRGGVAEVAPGGIRQFPSANVRHLTRHATLER
jgi:FtsZ-binding cell division protein ZapB